MPVDVNDNILNTIWHVLQGNHYVIRISYWTHLCYNSNTARPSSPGIAMRHSFADYTPLKWKLPLPSALGQCCTQVIRKVPTNNLPIMILPITGDGASECGLPMLDATSAMT